VAPRVLGKKRGHGERFAWARDVHLALYGLCEGWEASKGGLRGVFLDQRFGDGGRRIQLDRGGIGGAESDLGSGVRPANYGRQDSHQTKKTKQKKQSEGEAGGGAGARVEAGNGGKGGIPVKAGGGREAGRAGGSLSTRSQAENWGTGIPARIKMVSLALGGGGGEVRGEGLGRRGADKKVNL